MSDMNGRVFDVLIIGAGISGIGCACHLKRELPGKTFAILEARADLGGTWDLFKYPGIRSDSDLHTFSYEFKPWSNPNSIASGEEIMTYLRETGEEYGVKRQMAASRLNAAGCSLPQATTITIKAFDPTSRMKARSAAR